MIQTIKKIFTGIRSLIQGMFITSKNLLTPAVTLQYPDQKDTMTENYRGWVDLDVSKCIACNQCVKICPTGCLALTHKQVEQKKVLETFTYNMEWCCFCGLCEEACPTSAIYMNKLYEISVYDHAPLHINLLDPDKYHEWHSINSQ